MENFFSRYRNASLLVLVLFAQVLGLAVQVKRTSESGGTMLIRFWTVSTITPLEKALVNTNQGMRNIWRNYFYLRGVRRENRELKTQIERMRIEQVRLSEDAAQARRLQTLLGFKEQFISKTVAAQVIGTSGSDQSHIIYIDKGSDDGIKPDMAVITPDGIVGKVLHVFHSSSQVLLINDSSSGVGAILETSRLQGILQGTAAGETMLRYVMSDEKVAAGERVLTSGGDRIFPKGLAIGTVQQSNPGSDLFLNIRIKPAADLSRLEEVLVVTKMVESAPLSAESLGTVRAADILAERLPKVPPKAPATPATASAAKATAPKPASATAAAAPSTSATAANGTQASKPATAQTNTTGAATPTKPPGIKPPATGSAGATAGLANGKPVGSKPAASTPQTGASAPTTGPNGIKPAVIKPAASKPGASAPSQASEGVNSAGQPPKTTAPPQTPPPTEDVSR